MNNGEIYFGIARSLYGILFIILYTYVRYVPSGMRALVPTFLNNIDFLKLRYYLFFFSWFRCTYRVSFGSNYGKPLFFCNLLGYYS